MPPFAVLEQLPAPPRYACYSSSARDGGVRRKEMKLPQSQWDLIELPDEAAEAVQALYRRTEGTPYDFAGVAAFILPFLKQDNYRWFCSEWCAQALGLTNPCRHSPETLRLAVNL